MYNAENLSWISSLACILYINHHLLHKHNHLLLPSESCSSIREFGSEIQTKMTRESIASEKMKFVIALVALQFFYAGFHIVSRLALNMGISKVVYPIYRNIIALFVLAPCAYFLEKKERPPLTFPLLVQFFLLALIGITANQGFYLLGLYYATPTFASAMQNSVPAITFLMAAVLGLEKVHISRRDGIAKVLGTLSSIGGATFITLYKGPLLLHSTHLSLGNLVQQDTPSSVTAQNWTWGCIYLFGHCLSWAGYLVFQAPVLKKYPAKLTLTSFTCFFGVIQFFIIAIFVQTDTEGWKINSTEELLTVLYAGLVASGVVISLQTWCIHKGGPVSVGVFQPVQTVLVAVMASLVLGDQLYSGGIIGTVFITVGLYAVLWGKNEEKRMESKGKEEDMLTTHLLDEESGEIESPLAENSPTKTKITC